MKCCYLCTAPPSQEVRVKVIVKVECCYLCTAPPSQEGLIMETEARQIVQSPLTLWLWRHDT